MPALDYPSKQALTDPQELGTLKLGSGMNTLVDAAKSASFRDGNIVIVFESGVEIRVPIGKNPRLATGSPKQLGSAPVTVKR
jgi:hypothetical protein